ncbi:MAG: hypothetical protein HQK77_21110, partial [Desulfobacterales bacterium]|nr:hypothetical protein [Desulfobacterales bacterium]
VGQSRGGINVSSWAEWGNETDWASKRPGWGGRPIHQTMVDTGVSIFFQGHDHLFAKEEKDGVIYVTCPMPAYDFNQFPGGNNDNSDAFTGDHILGPSGHVSVDVAPAGVTVSYKLAFTDQIYQGETFQQYWSWVKENGETVFSFNIDEGAGKLNSPVPDIKINGSDDKLILSLDSTISLNASLNAGDYAGLNSDWWLVADTSFGFYSYTFPEGCWKEGIIPVFQYPLVDISSPVELLNTSLPCGKYQFSFSIDDNADGVFNATWTDSIEVEIQ